MSEEIAAWLDIAAEEKADSILRLMPAATIKSVVEIGCGTGAVLAALGRRNFADEYWACEPAPDLARLIGAQEIPRLRGVATTTFDDAFGGQSFDLAILTHVVEHVLAPAVLLHQALVRARFVLVEVPIEYNLAGRARMVIRGRSAHTTAHPAGHVQFFSRRSVRLLVGHAGGVMLRQAGYFPRSAYAAQATHMYQRAVLTAARYKLPTRAYYEHFAILAQRRKLGAWDHHYAAPGL